MADKEPTFLARIVLRRQDTEEIDVPTNAEVEQRVREAFKDLQFDVSVKSQRTDK